MQSPSTNGENVFAKLRNDVLGIDSVVPILDGTQRRYTFLDNGASTPTFKSVMKAIEDFMQIGRAHV